MPVIPPLPTYPVLKRFSALVLRAKSSTDAARVLANARINFYQQGATVRVAGDVGPNGGTLSVAVWHPGTIQQFDTLMVLTDGLPPQQLYVPSPPTATSIPVRNDSGSPVHLDVGKRLVRLTAPPVARKDPNGLANESGSFVQTSPPSADPFAKCYIRETRFDYVVTFLDDNDHDLLDPPPMVFPDAEGSYVMR